MQKLLTVCLLLTFSSYSPGAQKRGEPVWRSEVRGRKSEVRKYLVLGILIFRFWTLDFANCPLSAICCLLPLPDSFLHKQSYVFFC